MKVELFALCEGAFNTNGRLTIVNTYDILKADKFPYKLPIGIALKLSFCMEDEGNNMVKILISEKETHNQVGVMESVVKIPHTDDVGYLCIAANIQGMVFPKPGWYNFDIFVAEKSVCRNCINVKQ